MRLYHVIGILRLMVCIDVVMNARAHAISIITQAHMS